jgi:hypothetical protein
MYSYEERLRLVKLYIKLGRRCKTSIRWVDEGAHLFVKCIFMRVIMHTFTILRA